jgi:hypothetical protein
MAQTTVASNTTSPDLSAFTAAMSKLGSEMSARKNAQQNPMNIPTEFDDTMLTLMAYDRV